MYTGLHTVHNAHNQIIVNSMEMVSLICGNFGYIMSEFSVSMIINNSINQSKGIIQTDIYSHSLQHIPYSKSTYSIYCANIVYMHKLIHTL